MRASWIEVRASYWFIPTLLTVAASLLAVATIHLDQSWGPDWLGGFAWFEPSRPEGARAQLNVVATSMLAVAGTVFAITIAAVAYASGNYGPRLLTNFMNDRGNQVSLGVFIATFVYNLLVLRVVHDAEADASGGGPAAAFVPQMSMLVSTASALIAVGVLVYFLHHIPASIRINTVLGGIGRRLVHDIEERFPIAGGATEPVRRGHGRPLTARDIGYIEIVDFAELDEIARKHGLEITLAVRTGDFVHPHLPMVELSGGEFDEHVARRILDCFSLGDARTPTQDLEFLIDELVEIGVRALSPGINDPFTAITSIHWIGAALARLADRDLNAGPEQEQYQVGRVRPMCDDFGHFLRRSFGGLRASAAASPTAAKIFIDSLCGIAKGATSRDRRKLLLGEARLLVAQAETALQGPALDEVRERLAGFEEAVRRLDEGGSSSVQRADDMLAPTA